MNNQRTISFLVLFFVSSNCFAQTRAFNQNSSRSNNAKAYTPQTDAWSFGLTNGGSFSVKSNEANLFRSTGFGTGFAGHYFFGPIGIGFNSGFATGSLSTTAINAFITERKYTGATATSSNAFNSYIMAGPSLRIGQRVQLIAEIKGGLFLNQTGGLSIGLQGVARPLYRFESGNKTLSPGLNAALSIAYPITPSSSLMIRTDFLQTSSSIRLLDPQRGFDQPTEQKRKTQILTAGISFVKTFELKHRDQQTGQSSGIQNHEIKSPRDHATGQSSGKMAPAENNNGSIIHPERTALLKTKTKSNQSNDRVAAPACGPVTQKITHPDGSIEEMTFACPDDAIAFQQQNPNRRISTNTTVPKQTQGATFGEKVNAGLHAAGGALAQGREGHIISGKIIHRNSTTGNGITTNAAVSSVGNLSSGGGASAASYAATGRVVNATPPSSGVGVHLYARDIATGMSSGKAVYQPIYADGQSQNEICNPCLVTVSNPVYTAPSTVMNNPLYQGKQAAAEPDQDCDGLAEGLTVYLIERTSGTVVATTITNRCGEYWFANVPTGSFNIEVAGSVSSRKGYQYYLAKSDMSIAGEIVAPNEIWEHQIINSNQDAKNNGNTINTIEITIGDTDGDGKADMFRVIGITAMGDSKDLTTKSSTSNQRQIIIPFERPVQKASLNTTRSNIKQVTVLINDQEAIDQVTVLFEDGTSRDITSLVKLNAHPHVITLNLSIADTDGDGATDLIWSPRSNLCITAKSASQNKSELDESIFNKYQQYRIAMPLSIGDLDGDGIPEVLAGNQIQNGASLLGGALPGGAVISAAMRPGTPIGGIIVKGGKNPGGQMRTITTNGYGEFEITGSEIGNYILQVETNYMIKDVVVISLINDEIEEKNTGTQNSPPIKTTVPKQTQGATFGEKVNAGTGNNNQTKAQDHNSSRSNKTASGIAPNPNDSSVIKVGINDLNSLLATIDAIDQQLANDATSNKTTITRSRSNIKTTRLAINSIQNDLNNQQYTSVKSKMAGLNTQLQLLQQALNSLGTQYSSISNVLKTKHDTAKNSVGNIR